MAAASRRGFGLISAVILIGSVVAVTTVGRSAHRWMWAQAELLTYRSTMHELSATVRTMRSRALAQRQVVQLRIDRARGMFQLASIRQRPRGYTAVERTLWLPRGLEISSAPTTLTALPNGRVSSASIEVVAPSCNKVFRRTTTAEGTVQLHEESTL